jgi:hypothetical protein
VNPLALLNAQLAAGFSGLAGSAAHVTLRISEPLLNDAIAAALPPDAAVRTVTLHPRGDNGFDATIVLRKPAFLPALHAQLTIERQPLLPADPVLVLRLAGGAGNLLKMAGPFLGGSLKLPPGVRLQDDLLSVDLRALLAAQGRAASLAYVTELHVATEASALVVRVAALVP